MADEGDLSSDIEEQYNARALRQHAGRQKERPEYDDDGGKICIDCSDVIPAERAKLDFVVRCIYCQDEEDKRERRGI